MRTATLLLVLLLLSAPSFAQFSRKSFTSVNDLALNGAARLEDGRIRLVPARSGQSGSAWFTTQQSISDGFDVTFSFQITKPGSNYKLPVGADGIAFVLQNSSTREGGKGGGIGYEGIRNSLAVEFDTYDNNGDKNPEPNDNHVSVHSQGEEPNSADHRTSLGWSKNIPRLANGARHTARILYKPGRLEVFIDDLQNPAVTAFVRIDSLIQLTDGKCWMGFTSATGQSWAQFDLLDISCTVSLTLRNILFDNDRATLKEESTPDLTRLLNLIQADSTIQAEVAGHTDSNGDDEHNMQLSTARAESVCAWLAERGVLRGRLTARGFGETRPIADNATEEGRALNRRVEVRLWSDTREAVPTGSVRRR